LFKVHIKNLTFKTIIGILDFERTQKQKIIINISFRYKFDTKKSNFIDYSEVAKLVKKTMKKKKFGLLEEAIIYLKKKLKRKYKIKNLYIKIEKPDILKNCEVGISHHCSTHKIK